MSKKTLCLYADGASRGNPGNAAAAYLLVSDKKILFEEGNYLGITTNNVAEYTAIIKAMQKAKEFTNDRLIIYSDSQLVTKQLNGEWKIRKKHLKILNDEIKRLSKEFESVRFIHVSRDNPFIRRADKAANDVLDDRN
ncbi:MAG: ribonuclease HI family protein [Candidatus Methanofastidiosia archaeon]